MKRITIFTFINLAFFSLLLAQEKKASNVQFKLFNRSSLSYVFGINQTVLNEKINSLHIKTVIGLASPRVGFGIGLENGSFRSANSTNGANFNTLAFSGNLHLLANPLQDDDLNFFIKGAAGYAVRVFNGYDKGLNYEAALGSMLTTKRGSKYFLQAIYNYQEIDGFALTTGKPVFKSFGVGIGTWL